jgi:hypothetical protein
MIVYTVTETTQASEITGEAVSGIMHTGFTDPLSRTREYLRPFVTERCELLCSCCLSDDGPACHGQIPGISAAQRRKALRHAITLESGRNEYWQKHRQMLRAMTGCWEVAAI